jgi:hypothetical protein
LPFAVYRLPLSDNGQRATGNGARQVIGRLGDWVIARLIGYWRLVIGDLLVIEALKASDA